MRKKERKKTTVINRRKEIPKALDQRPCNLAAPSHHPCPEQNDKHDVPDTQPVLITVRLEPFSPLME